MIIHPMPTSYSTILVKIKSCQLDLVDKTLEKETSAIQYTGVRQGECKELLLLKARQVKSDDDTNFRF